MTWLLTPETCVEGRNGHCIASKMTDFAYSARIRQRIICVELGARRCAAMPDMANRKSRRQCIIKYWEAGCSDEKRYREDRVALHVMSRVQERLAKRTIRRVFVDWTFVDRLRCDGLGDLPDRCKSLTC